MQKEKIGTMSFILEDWRTDEFNESVDLTYDLFGNEETELMSMEKYYNYCRYFAAAMGFAPKTIDEWFGED